VLRLPHLHFLRYLIKSFRRRCLEDGQHVSHSITYRSCEGAVYTFRMAIERLSQPSNLDPIDESALASVGHRIEIWQEMKNPTLPFEERKSRFMRDTESEMESLLHAQKEGSMPYLEAALLNEDLAFADALEDNAEVISKVCDERINYYSEVRKNFLRDI